MPPDDSANIDHPAHPTIPGRNGGQNAGDGGDYDQTNRPLELLTTLPRNALLLVGFQGTESISRLFDFRLDLIAKHATQIPFKKLMGQPVAIRVSNRAGRNRYFHGFCTRFSQGGRGTVFTHYSMSVVPHLWFLMLRARSRIFQQIAVPDILRKVLDEYRFDVDYRAIKGDYEPRDYCVQYRESDFQFLSRLMEEEGIYYYFRHEENRHVLVLADGPQGLFEVNPPALYEELLGNNRPEDRIFAWHKSQQVRPGRVTLWDHTFEIPHDHLEAHAALERQLHVGQVDHTLTIAGNDQLEIYDYPGEYAQRFDGIDPMGGERRAELAKIAHDNARMAQLRMQELQTPAVLIDGASTRTDLAPGGVFELKRHFDADGRYLVTEVRHAARMDSHYRSDDASAEWSYDNKFACVPAETPYRPARLTPKPVIQGPQTAVVTGSPTDEEIFTDKYGRVKVQFHWDREGQHDALTSCWIRVAQIAAGGNWGGIFIPRVGHEVVVTFEEGDPDRPLITGCVYNDQLMPPFKLPEQRMLSGYRSNSYKKGGGSNEFHVDDTKGKERMYIHAQYNQDSVVENNRTTKVGVDCDEQIGNNKSELVGNDKTVRVVKNESTTIGVDQTLAVGSNQTNTIGSNQKTTVVSNQTTMVGSAQSTMVGSNQGVVVGANQAVSVAASRNLSVGMTRTSSIGITDMINVGVMQNISAGVAISISAGVSAVMVAGVSLQLQGPGGQISIDSSGITIQGKLIKIQGGLVEINP